MSLFEAVKQNLTTRQAAEMYGIQVSRHGMAVCPFHNDKNPSMKVDKRFHCFACQADEWHPLFVEALQRESHIEYLLDVLLYSTAEEKRALVAQADGRGGSCRVH